MEECKDACEIALEFSGGLEALTLNQAKFVNLRILAESLTVAQLIAYVRRNVFGAKRDLFSYPPEVLEAEGTYVVVEGDYPGVMNKLECSNVRVGVLVLIDDIDWELLGAGEHVLKGVRSLSFISSLHGG